MMNKWTQSEIKLLKKLFPNMKNFDIAEKIGRTLEAVKFKARTLGLKKAEGHFLWTDAQVKLLKKLFTNRKIRVDEIADRLGRGVKAVRNKAIELGLKRRKHPR